MRTKSLSVLLAAVIAVVLAASMPGLAQQQKCQDLQAIWQGSITIVNGEAHWGGPVVAAIGDEVLEGTVSTIVVPWRTNHGVTGMDRGTQYLYDFGDGNTFTLELNSTGTFPNPPGKAGFGYYRDVSVIVAGTGRFSNVSGNVAQNGPFLVWFTSELKSLYTAELRGRVCLP